MWYARHSGHLLFYVAKRNNFSLSMWVLQLNIGKRKNQVGRKRSILSVGQQSFLVTRPSESLLTVYVPVLCLSPLNPEGVMRLILTCISQLARKSQEEPRQTGSPAVAPSLTLPKWKSEEGRLNVQSGQCKESICLDFRALQGIGSTAAEKLHSPISLGRLLSAVR